MPIERFKDGYANWRYNPFTDESLAVDKTEDNLTIPSSSPFQIQLLELPRKDNPSSVEVYCYDDSAYFTEISGNPAQGQFRVDYPPGDGKGTGLIEFNSNDAGKTVKISYKATGSPILKEYLDTKISYPADEPQDNQIIGFKNGSPEWRNNPIRYFHEGNVIYHSNGEDESCFLFRFKKSVNESVVKLELKGAKLHQGYYTELKSHSHDGGSLAAASSGSHSHTIVSHSHGAGTLEGSQPAHSHGYGSLSVSTVADHNHVISSHTHGLGTLAVSSGGSHTHSVSGETGTGGGGGSHYHTLSDENFAINIGSGGSHTHSVSGNTGSKTASHTHGAGTLSTDSSGSHTHSVSGKTGDISNSHCHTLPDHQHTVGTLSGSQPTHSHSYMESGGSPDYTGISGGDDVTISGHTGNLVASKDTTKENTGHTHNFSVTSGSGGSHSHSLSGSTASGGSSHSHSISLTTGSDGSHTHTASIDTYKNKTDSVAGDDHTHSIDLTSGSGGSHSHSLSGALAGSGDLTSSDGGGHNHTISGLTGDSGDDVVTITGQTGESGELSTSETGSHSHSITGQTGETGVMEKSYPDSLKVYINGVDKTADILSKSGLSELGDGTQNHSFVTTGTSEMDISDLIASDGFHEIKITEPTVDKGGRVLLHLEVY